MKTLAIITLLVSLWACSSEQPKTDSILFDITEKDHPEFVLDSKSGIGYTNDLWQGRTVRFSTITDIDHNEVIELSLEEQNEFTSNRYDREKELHSFLKELGKLCVTDTLEYEHSSIWIPLTEELAYLSKCHGKSTCYLVSDCKEHTDWVSLYNPRTLGLLQTDPKRVQEIFVSELPEGLRKTDKVKLVIVHKPRGMQENFDFRLVVERLYKPILEDSLGIEISVKATL